MRLSREKFDNVIYTEIESEKVAWFTFSIARDTCVIISTTWESELGVSQGITLGMQYMIRVSAWGLGIGLGLHDMGINLSIDLGLGIGMKIWDRKFKTVYTYVMLH